MKKPKRRWLYGLLMVGAGIALSASSCDNAHKDTTSAQAKGQAVTQQAYDQLKTAVPYPVDQMTDSVELRNLRERLLRLNKPDKIGYVYLFGQNGNVVAFYTIKGKVTNNSSQMTTDQLIVPCQGGSGCREGDRFVVSAPGDDGSYGPNEPGVFFFTTEGVLITTSLPYVYTDAPLSIQAQPVAVLPEGSKPSSTAGG